MSDSPKRRGRSDLVPPSRKRTRAPVPAEGVWFSLNVQDMVAELVAKARDGDPETLALLGLPASEERADAPDNEDSDEPPPSTERSAR